MHVKNICHCQVIVKSQFGFVSIFGTDTNIFRTIVTTFNSTFECDRTQPIFLVTQLFCTFATINHNSNLQQFVSYVFKTSEDVVCDEIDTVIV